MEIYQHIFEGIPDALLVVCADGHMVNVNTLAATIFGYAREELIGAKIELLVPARFSTVHVGHRERFVADPSTRRMAARSLELQARHRDGHEFPVDVMISQMRTQSKTFVLCAVRDVTERFAMEEQLRRRTAELETLHEQMKILASRDGLTDLLNRRTFQEQVEWLLRNAKRRGESLSLLLLDLDYFKQVNDRFGHAEGDRVLKAVADVLRATCRENDIAARHGGEEFAVALPNTPKPGALIVAEAFRKAIACISGVLSPVSASVGVVTFTPSTPFPSADKLFAGLINDADRALYAAKHAGRNRVCHASSLTVT